MTVAFESTVFSVHETEDGNLSLTPGPDINSITDDEIVQVLVDYGLEPIRPEEIGALTSAPIFALGVERDDDGELRDMSRVFWYPSYQLYDWLEELRRGGVTLTLAA